MNKLLDFKNILLMFCLVFILISCANKKEFIEEYNKPATYWYNKMIIQISGNYLDDADDLYTSLESEHRNSPLLPTALLILANGHINQEEYALANFYLDEYITKYALSKNIDYVRFLKIKANFLGFSYQLREQELIESTIIEIKKFKLKFPNSEYINLVNTMNARLHMAKAYMDYEIANLYKKLDKPKAADLYTKKAQNAWINPKEIIKPKVPFYRAVFE